jgi:hypothetical protein
MNVESVDSGDALLSLYWQMRFVPSSSPSTIFSRYLKSKTQGVKSFDGETFVAERQGGLRHHLETAKRQQG